MISLDQLLSQKSLQIQQKPNISETILDLETKNTYRVLDEKGQGLANVREITKDVFGMHILRSKRSFEMLVESAGQELFRFSRPSALFLSRVSVFQKDGKSMGSIKQRFNFFSWKYDFRDEGGRIFAKSSSPFWSWKLKIKNPQGQLISEIEKKWSGMLRESVTNADHFAIQFSNASHSLTISQKAVLLAGVINFDFGRFEKS